MAGEKRRLLAATCSVVGLGVMVSIILLLLALPLYPWTLVQDAGVAVLSGLGFTLAAFGASQAEPPAAAERSRADAPEGAPSAGRQPGGGRHDGPPGST